MKRILFLFLFFSASLVMAGSGESGTSGGTGHSILIYKSDACSHCTPYVESLMSTLNGVGYDPSVYQIKDFLNDNAARIELANLQEKFSVPLTMQGHMAILIDDKYLFEGHVPAQLISSFLQNDAKNYDTIVVTQDSMSEASSYKLLSEGKIKECDIAFQFTQCDKDSGTASVSAGYEKFITPAIIITVPLAAIAFLILKK